MKAEDWIRPPPPGAAYRWRLRKNGLEFRSEWLGGWHNPGRRTHHALWRVESGDERFAEALAEIAEMLGPAPS